MNKKQEYVLYKDSKNDIYYLIEGNNITDLIAIKMLKASGIIVSKENVKHMKNLIFIIDKIENTKNNKLNMFGQAMQMRNIPLQNVKVIKNNHTLTLDFEDNYFMN